MSGNTAADSIHGQAVSGFDFPAVILRAWADGVRVFLEMGPHASCTGMVDAILDGKPHVAVSASKRGEDETLSILKCLGTLIAEGVPIETILPDGECDLDYMTLRSWELMAAVA